MAYLDGRYVIVEFMESYCQISLVTHTIEVYCSGSVDVQLPYIPVTFDSITVVDENDSSVDYNVVGKNSTAPYIWFNGSPTHTYKITYNTTANSDYRVKAALFHLVKWMYDNTQMGRSNIGFTSFITDKMNIDAMRLMDDLRLM